MRHLRPSVLSLCVLFVFAPICANAQRVFVGTLYRAVTAPTQLGQQVILASVPVGDTMRTLKTFDVLAVGTFSTLGGGGNYDLGISICDKVDCSGQLNAPIALSGRNQTQQDDASEYLRVSGTFAQTNPGKPSAAILAGYIYGYIGFNRLSQQSYLWQGLEFGPAEDVTPPTQPIDLYSGNRYVVVIMNCDPQGPCLVPPPFPTATISLFRVSLLP